MNMLEVEISMINYLNFIIAVVWEIVVIKKYHWMCCFSKTSHSINILLIIIVWLQRIINSAIISYKNKKFKLLTL